MPVSSWQCTWQGRPTTAVCRQNGVSEPSTECASQVPGMPLVASLSVFLSVCQTHSEYQKAVLQMEEQASPPTVRCVENVL
ncbi:hypothetical protein TREES_T100002990 [Tupaia chinensis]|uniref:Uncharacterized protein n=1 Tax=Tupaia chinensis TaxID=246437 RepID=L9KUI2_TUPCH|nr:hypothetical protein TREES_T100002990 [Tupaia chinensis]